MRNLSRNESTIYYALYRTDEEAVDADGLYTGVIVPAYESPVPIRASVSAARGTSDVDLFGVNISYTKTVIVDDMSCPIDEHSRLWIDASTDAPHNYEVVMVAKSLNHIAYAVQRVDYSS
jgi:hypothetical protein